MNNLLSLTCIIFCLFLAGCSDSSPGTTPVTSHQEEPEAIARTEFTDRLENFFEYEPLVAGRPSQVRIHLTDLSDGSPVEKAEVALTVREKGGNAAVVQIKALVGKVTGIYVAELNIPRKGEYDIEFHIKNTKLEGRMPLSDFKVE